MWSEFEREVKKQPHNTLASLKAKISQVMTNIDREIVILTCQRFWSEIGAVVEASGNLIKQMYIMRIQMFPEIFINIYSN